MQNRGPRPHIVTLVALGGEGKTSLVAKWPAEFAANDWPGCDIAPGMLEFRLTFYFVPAAAYNSRLVFGIFPERAITPSKETTVW